MGALLRLETEDDFSVGVRTEKKALAGSEQVFFSRACGIVEAVYVSFENLRESYMKTKTRKKVAQPAPFTPGITKGMVRQHACELFRDKLAAHPLTLEDWVLAEKDLVGTLETEEAAG